MWQKLLKEEESAIAGLSGQWPPKGMWPGLPRCLHTVKQRFWQQTGFASVFYREPKIRKMF